MMDIQKFEDKYRKYKATVYRIAFSYMKNREECEDVLQEMSAIKLC